jgi:hypothetical protein
LHTGTCGMVVYLSGRDSIAFAVDSLAPEWCFGNRQVRGCLVRWPQGRSRAHYPISCLFSLVYVRCGRVAQLVEQCPFKNRTNAESEI